MQLSSYQELSNKCIGDDDGDDGGDGGDGGNNGGGCGCGPKPSHPCNPPIYCK